MKKSIYIAIAAIAFLSTASCQKESMVSDNSAEQEVRTITATFENSGTKTSPDVGTDQTVPMWEVGDVIRLLDAPGTPDESVHYQDVRLTQEMMTVDSTVVTFTTTLKGTTLYAVYPALATDMTSCSGDVTFKISEEQDGSFAKANISVAKADNGHLVFCNATSVLEFTQTAATTAVKRVQVRAANPISGELKATFGTDNKVNNVTLTTPGAHTIVATTPSEAKDTYYIAVAPVATGAIEFKYNKGLGAYPDNVAVYSDAAGRTLVRNKIYRGSNLSMDSRVYGIDYVNIKAKYDGANETPLKWAVENLAISPSGRKAWKGNGTESLWHVVGDYFQWAAHAGYCGNATDSDKGLLIYESFNNTGCGDAEDAFEFKSAGNGKNYWFYILDGTNTSNKAVSPHFSESSGVWKETGYDYPPYEAYGIYTKYDTNDSEIPDYYTLRQNDDVANIIYGVDWRMPKSSEFIALQEATYWAWDANDMGYYVFNPTSSNQAGYYDDSIPLDLYKIDALLFFPAAGYADTDVDLTSTSFPGGEPVLADVGTWGDYWSASLDDCPNYTDDYSIDHYNAALGLDIYRFYDEDFEEFFYDVDTKCSLNRYLGCSVRPVGVVTANNPNPTETGPEQTVF